MELDIGDFASRWSVKFGDAKSMEGKFSYAKKG